MAFDMGLFNEVSGLAAPASSGVPIGSFYITDPRHPLNKSGVGLPQFFKPLPAVARVAKRYNKPNAGRTMPLKTALKLSDVAQMNVDGFPSISLNMGSNGAAEISIVRHSKYWEYFADDDKKRIWDLQDEMFHVMQAYSGGPYSLRMLRGMGHPYGYGFATPEATRKSRRRVPRRSGGASIGHVPTIRGSVPTMSVINRQSGLLATSWREEREETDNGYILRFLNTAKSRKGFPYAWALAVGTVKMQPHGPWTDVPTTFIRRLNSAHMKAVMRARHASIALAMAEGEDTGGTTNDGPNDTG